MSGPPFFGRFFSRTSDPSGPSERLASGRSAEPLRDHARLVPSSASAGLCLACGLILGAQTSSAPARRADEAPRTRSAPRDGQHDFDFEIGTWKTHLKRLARPFTGSKEWVEYDGSTVVRKVWNGAANLVELAADGPAGHFEGLSLRLYNPGSGQWSLNFANRKVGTMTTPSIGEFKKGRGEFYQQETLDGRAILVRFVISDVTASSCRFEQAFSDDGGKTWEVNWIATDTRTGP